jgi:Transposase Tn5 dimerisation domain
MIIAWRVMFIEMLARSAPEIRCSVIFDEHEWKPVYAIVEGKKPPKKTPM